MFHPPDNCDLDCDATGSGSRLNAALGIKCSPPLGLVKYSRGRQRSPCRFEGLLAIMINGDRSRTSRRYNSHRKSRSATKRMFGSPARPVQASPFYADKDKDL